MAQVVPQVKVLHDCGDPRLGVFVSDERGEAVAQVELGSASRAQRWGQLSSSGDDHPPEGIAPDVCGGGQSLSERLRNRRLPGCHQTGDDQNRRLLKHRARMLELRHGVLRTVSSRQSNSAAFTPRMKAYHSTGVK